MQNFNNYGNPSGLGNMNVNRNYVGGNNYNNVNPGNMNNTGWNNGWMYQANGYNQGFNPAPVQSNGRIFVTGRAGADAYQLPPGVNEQILWDDDSPRFYVKGYDEKGRPRVLEDNDYQGHVDSDVVKNDIDMSLYATKDDIKALMSDALKKIKMPNLNGYVTTDDLNKALSEFLSELCVGSGGKVIRSGELDV